MEKSLTQLTADIVAAQAAHKPMTAEELSDLLRETYESLNRLKSREEGAVEAAPAPVPALERMRAKPVSSIQKNQVTCLECGATFKQLTSGHLKEHGLTPREYRRKWNLSLRQPLSSQALSEKRRKTAESRNAGEILKQARKKKAAERRAAKAPKKPKTVLRKKSAK
ncbi:MAG: MucR family transcriptional regulator [Deltaproteobacteria bacterium]|nr:MucR family transcriptional regulator [Deltaproteobacteria bacterium]